MRLSCSCLFSFLLAVHSTSMVAQDTASKPTGETVQQPAGWSGTLADKSLLTQEKLDELLAAHCKWLKTAEQRIDEERAKAGVKLEDDLSRTWRRKLLASDWGAREGRLVLKEATLRNVTLAGVDLRNANLEGTDLLAADLKGAKLQDADLRGVDLTAANLGGAELGYSNLEGATLRKAVLIQAKLRDANLQRAKLGGADLRRAELPGANLEESDLSNAILEETDLRSAYLRKAKLVSTNLRGSDLSDANLEGTNLQDANLEGVHYEVMQKLLPDVVSLRSAGNLAKMYFTRSPHALEELRQEFKKEGYRQQEREITYALKQSENQDLIKRGKWFEAGFNWLFFDLPVHYGLEPGRALIILVWSIVVFAVPYLYPVRKHRMWRIWPGDGYEPITVSGWWRVALYAFYFSLLSAFQIGWRELNVGNWITRIQPRAYVLQVTGWVRTISGIQSLLSVYLLVIWVLTYFGRPFE